MAITSGSFNSPGTPDKHIVAAKTSSGPTSSGGDDSAANVYGTPGDGTRMNRREGLVSEALSATPNGISGAENTGPAFVDGSTASGFSTVNGVKNAGSVSITDDNVAAVDSEKLPARGPIQASKAVTAKSSASNNPAVKGSPGFPGLP